MSKPLPKPEPEPEAPKPLSLLDHSGMLDAARTLAESRSPSPPIDDACDKPLVSMADLAWAANQAPAPKVYQAISDVTAMIVKGGGIAKGGKNQDQKYMFRGIDQLLDSLAPLLPKARLVIVPTYSKRMSETRATRNGGAIYSVVVKGRFRFISTIDGSSVTCVTVGESMDTSDKGTNKAMSAAFKYALTQTFNLPFDVEDADLTTPEETVAPGAPVEPPKPAPPKVNKAAASAAGKKMQAAALPAPKPNMAEAQKSSITGLMEFLGYTWDDVRDLIRDLTGKDCATAEDGRKMLTTEDRAAVVASLREIVDGVEKL